jgi:hypothetical protein
MDYQVGDVVEWCEFGTYSMLVLVRDPEPDMLIGSLAADYPDAFAADYPDGIPLTFRGEVIGHIGEAGSPLGGIVSIFSTQNLEEKIVRVLGPEEAAAAKAAYAASPVALANREYGVARAAEEARAQEESGRPLDIMGVMYRAGPLGYVHIADVIAAGQLSALCGRYYRWSQPVVRPTPETRFCNTCDRVARAKGHELPEGWGG